jgi:hypothetical protein
LRRERIPITSAEGGQRKVNPFAAVVDVAEKECRTIAEVGPLGVEQAVREGLRNQMALFGLQNHPRGERWRPRCHLGRRGIAMQLALKRKGCHPGDIRLREDLKAVRTGVKTKIVRGPDECEGEAYGDQTNRGGGR